MTMSDVERVTGRNAVLGYGGDASCQQSSLSGAPGLGRVTTPTAAVDVRLGTLRVRVRLAAA